MRFNRFLENHLTNIIARFGTENTKGDIFLNNYFKNTNLGKRDRNWLRERFFYYLRYKFFVEKISVRTGKIASVISMLHDDEPDEKLKEILNKPEDKGELEHLKNWSFNQFLYKNIKSYYGNDSHLWFNSKAETIIRANFKKIVRKELSCKLEKEGYKVSDTEFSPAGIIIKGESSSLKNTELFKNGFFEFQDESSQLTSFLVNPVHKTLFDCCAGGGGKTLSTMNSFPNMKITASDIRPRILKEIRLRALRSGIKVSIKTLPQILNSTFDTVFIDAPCSGSGVLRRNPSDRYFIDEKAVVSFSHTQNKILSQYSQNVSEKGEIIYVTCSFLKEENELVIDSFLNSHKNYEIFPAKERFKENFSPDRNIDKLFSGNFFRVDAGDKRDILFGAILRKIL
jgi:16S rRNA C967 or C1407 C5-methylase (RsmB/RsmF family)